MIKKEKIIEMTLQGMTIEEISKEVNSSCNVIRCITNKNGLKANRYKLIVEDENFIQFIIGSMAGDGTIEKITGLMANSNLKFLHCKEQKDFVEWKRNFLESYHLAPIKLSHGFIKDDRLKLGYSENYGFKTKSHPIFTKYRNIFYPNNIRIIPKEFINKLNAFGLAIMYMDNGNVTTYSFEISTMGFDDESVNNLVNALKNNFNIDCTTVLDKRCNGRKVYILASSREDFITLLKPYILPCMEYKLIPYYKRVLNKSDKLLENPVEDNQQLITTLNE